MKQVTNFKKMIKLADKDELSAVLTRLWSKGFIGQQILKVIYFSDDGTEFFIKTDGIRYTTLSRKTKNYTFFT